MSPRRRREAHLGGTNHNPWPLALGLTGACVLTMILGVVVVAQGAQPEKLTPPTSFTPFRAKDGSFACEYPTGWKESSGESQGIASNASFRQGDARISIRSDLTGSLMADMARPPGGMPAGENPGEFGGGGGGGLPPELGALPGMPGGGGGARRPVIDTLHESEGRDYAETLAENGFSDYQEQPAKPFQSAVGEGRISEFTARGSLFSPATRGYRVTLMGTQRAIFIKARGPQSQWGMLKPAFERTIRSVQAGN